MKEILKKNRKAVKSHDFSNKPYKIVLKNGYKLSQAINKLPHGIIHKNQTGIGATTAELRARRNSIIVEPLKITASSKAGSDPNRYLYLGSPTNHFPSPITDEEVKAYLNNPNIKYKKLLVVVDSLPRILEIITPDRFDDYFLMIDESDSIQMESGFRNEAMEQCMQFFKKFRKKNRCLVSATPIRHHDPDLQDEQITEFTYEQDFSRSIQLIYPGNILQSLKDRIISIRAEDPGNIIVIAYNNIKELKDLADSLVQESVPEKEVKILCSGNNKGKAAPYFAELEAEEWPANINLKTSAYFTGFDINARYHLITVVNSSTNLNCHSPNRIKQIVGRCRHNIILPKIWTTG